MAGKGSGRISLVERRRMIAEGLYSINEAAQFLNVSRFVIYRLIKSGSLSTTRVSCRVFIPRVAAQEFLALNTTLGKVA